MLSQELYQNLVDVANGIAKPNPALLIGGLVDEQGKITPLAEEMLAASQVYIVPHLASGAMTEDMAMKLLESGYTVDQVWMARGNAAILQPGQHASSVAILHDVWIPPRKNMVPVQGLIAMFVAHAKTGGDIVTLDRLCKEIIGQPLPNLMEQT